LRVPARAAFVGAAVSFAAIAAVAQTSAASADSEPPARPIAAASAAPESQVAAGSVVIIELVEPVSTKTVKRGDMFSIRLSAAVTLGDRTVIPAGAPGMGQVVEAQPSDTLGRPAKLLLAARYLDVDGTHVPLKAMQFGRVGDDKTGVVMAASFIPYVGFLGVFLHGGEIEIPAGTLARAKLAGDVPVAQSAAPPPAAAPAQAPTDAPIAAPPAPGVAPTSSTNLGDHP
jgi:hypothetical protein